MKVETYVINKGTPAEYYGLKKCRRKSSVACFSK